MICFFFQGHTQADETKLAGRSRVRAEKKEIHQDPETETEKHTQGPVLFVLMNTSVRVW